MSNMTHSSEEGVREGKPRLLCVRKFLLPPPSPSPSHSPTPPAPPPPRGASEIGLGGREAFLEVGLDEGSLLHWLLLKFKD